MLKLPRPCQNVLGGVVYNNICSGEDKNHGYIEVMTNESEC